MKLIKKILILSVTVLASISVMGQEDNVQGIKAKNENSRLVEKGNKLFKNFAYNEAIKFYLRAVEKEDKSIAVSYTHLTLPTKA